MTEHSSNTGNVPDDLRRGIELHNSGNLAAAEGFYRKVLEQPPSHPDALHLLGLIKYQKGDASQACELMRQAIGIRSDNFLYYNNLATACLDLRRIDEAVEAAKSAVRLAPNNADAFATLGTALHRSGQTSQAESLLHQALGLNPDHVDALVALGYLQLQEGRYEDAEDSLKKAVTITPSHTSALVNYGKALIKLERAQEAVELFKRARANAPSVDAICTLLADALLRNNEPENALDVLEQGANENPDNADTLSDMGHVLRDLNRNQEALSYFDRALRINPEHVDAHVNKGLELLSQGKFDKAWQHYAYRSKQPAFLSRRPALDTADWASDRLEEQSITVWSEQGLGDEILQMSLLPDLIKTAKDVTLICSDRLARLCRRSFPSIKVLSPDENTTNPTSANIACPLLDTARVLRNGSDKFPAKSGYLVAEPELEVQLRAKYRQLIDHQTTPLIVAISWQSGHPLYGHRNTMPLSGWAPIFQASRLCDRPVLFVAAQYDADPGEVEAAKAENETLIYQDPDVDHGSDLDIAAAQLAASDLVISTSTTTAQLAAAMGKPVWHLPSSGLACGWYWLSAGTTTPWYPTMRQFRGTERGVSKKQVLGAANALKELLAS